MKQETRAHRESKAQQERLGRQERLDRQEHKARRGPKVIQETRGLKESKAQQEQRGRQEHKARRDPKVILAPRVLKGRKGHQGFRAITSHGQLNIRGDTSHITLLVPSARKSLVEDAIKAQGKIEPSLIVIHTATMAGSAESATSALHKL